MKMNWTVYRYLGITESSFEDDYCPLEVENIVPFDKRKFRKSESEIFAQWIAPKHSPLPS